MKKYLKGIDVKGIIQVGANLGQEVPLFKKFTDNIILIEPLSACVQSLKVKYPTYLILETALGTLDTRQNIYVASNHGASSSLLKPVKHLTMHPSIKFKTTQNVKVRRFDTLARNLHIDMRKFNVVITDTQGCDLDALKGFGTLLDFVDLIISEYINIELYEGNQGLDALTEYLTGFGFELAAKFSVKGKVGNAVFKKK